MMDFFHYWRKIGDQVRTLAQRDDPPAAGTCCRVPRGSLPPTFYAMVSARQAVANPRIRAMTRQHRNLEMENDNLRRALALRILTEE